jgi:diadenosine tetraphosphate (Ap4A) HIT family hydrolase
MAVPGIDPECFICRKQRGEIALPGGAVALDEQVYIGHAQIRPGEATAYLGYLMVEPRRHVPGLEHLRDIEAQALGVWVARLSRALVAVLGADHVYAFVIGDRVHHVHVHVVARYPGAPPEYRGPRVDEWPEAPRGGEREIEALCGRLRAWLSAHGTDEALGS